MTAKIGRQEVTELLAELIRIPSPYFAEAQIMEFARGWLEQRNVPARVHTYFDEKVTGERGENIVGCLDSGRVGPCIYLNGHLDTVKLCEGWTVPPYDGIIQGRLMYGVGALDMKAGCAALMSALAAFRENVRSFHGRIIYHFVSDEEGPFGLGTTFLIRDGEVDRPDFALVAEPSAGFVGQPFPVISPGARGGYNYIIRVEGTSAHAAAPEAGVNAAVDAAKIICELEHIPMRTDPKLGPASNCVIALRGGGSACSVPDTAEIEVFRHIVTGESIRTIEAEVREAVRRANISGAWQLVMREAPCEGFDGGFLPFTTPEDSPYIKQLIHSVESVCGEEPRLSYFRSMGDFNLIAAAGIPTVLFGPEGKNYHSADECVDLGSVYKTAETIYDFLIRITGAEERSDRRD